MKRRVAHLDLAVARKQRRRADDGDGTSLSSAASAASNRPRRSAVSLASM
jgi:hypothetical protein